MTQLRGGGGAYGVVRHFTAEVGAAGSEGTVADWAAAFRATLIRMINSAAGNRFFIA
jgi:hypothetical protein